MAGALQLLNIMAKHIHTLILWLGPEMIYMIFIRRMLIL